MKQRFQMYIDGQSRDASSGLWFDSDNPYTGEVWAEIARGNADDADAAVQAAYRAGTTGPWAELTASQRGMLLHRLGDLIARDAAKLAEIEVRDNGKLYSEMLGQLSYIPQWFYYFGGLADKIEGGVPQFDKKGYFAFTRREPVGVVVAITPWNSPLMLTAWKIAPALAAGCTVVLKPSEFTSASTLAFIRLFEEAGFPPGVVNAVTGFGADVGAALVEHPLVNKITFTGSDTTGRAINEQAARHFKSVSLELGGKSPNIVFDDANIDDAVNGAISGIFAASGQTCIAGSRLLLQSSIHDAFVQKLKSVVQAARMGDPMDPNTQIAPVTTAPQYAKVLQYIAIAQEEGATLLMGGKPAFESGRFVEPTVFCDVDNSMRIAQEEVFGPVLSIIRFDTEEDALRIANDVRFGLGAGVWTSDVGRMHRMAAGLKAGSVWVNTYRLVSYMTPFGGYKDSGLGRENGIDAIGEYLQTKSVVMNIGAQTTNPFVMR